ncbi:MAG: type II toxin-antitoxin system RatA family toxin [Dehalococcoidia bacterium]
MRPRSVAVAQDDKGLAVCDTLIGMETTNEILIRAPAADVFALAANTERWPQILPHYRWVRRLRGADDHKVVEMAARRDFYPVRWVAVQHNFREEHRITFRHVRGISRGMEVEWTITPTPDGAHVRIWHEFHSSLPIVGEFFAHRIVGQLFVSNIAGKTLREIKRLAERGGDSASRETTDAARSAPAH